MMNTMWNIEAIRWQKASVRLDCQFSPNSKEAKHERIFLFSVIGVNKITDLNIDFRFNYGLWDLL